MAVEISNFFEMGGIFDGRMVSPNSPIVSAEGVLPLDVNSTVSHPRGGFQKIATGTYVIGMERKIDGLEGILLATFIAGSMAAPGANIACAPYSNLDGYILVSNPSNPEIPADYAFYLRVLRIKYGPNATLSNDP